MKEPKCKICGGPHYRSFCFQAPKTPIVTRKPLQPSRKPIKQKLPTLSSVKQKPLRRAAIRPKSKKQRATLIEKLDRVFSVYIRRKDSVGGLARCVTCGFKAPWRQMQNGHFISRRKMSVRWSEMNCHVQCPNCNEALGGNLAKYKEYMEMTYGSAATFRLQQKSNSSEKLSNDELSTLIKHYQEKVAKLV